MYFAFSKILVDITEGKEIGSFGTGYSKKIYKWKYGDVISTSEFNHMAEREMSKTGYKTIGENKLFEEQNDQPKEADLLLGGNLKDIKISSDGKKRSQVLIAVTIEWQVFNRKRAKVILKQESNGYANCDPEDVDNGLKEAFKNGFGKFINTDTFYSSVVAMGSKYSGNSKVKPVVIKKVKPKAYKERSEMIAECLKSVLTIKTDQGHGSGFIISAEGYIVTNYHVVNGAKEINAIFDGGFSLPATVYSYDENNDLALLKIQGGGFKALPIGNSDSLIVGTDVVAMGTPASLDLSQTVTKGMVSSKRDIDGHEYLQTDVSVNPGNSGGPLLNMKGQVSGIISRGIRTAQGLNFAIPSNVLMSILKITYDE